MRRPTLRDVAEAAGVHPATASRALDPALPGRIGAETTQRVQEAARRLGYTPDPLARGLRTRRSGVVGVVVPDLTNPVIPPIVRGIEEALWTAGRGCLLADTDNDPEREAAHVAQLVARRCEALIVATAARTSPTVAALAGGDVPTVLVTRDVDAVDLPIVAADDAAGVTAAVEHLAGLGHRRIVHLTGPSDLSTTVRRAAAFRAAIARLGLGDDPLVLHGEAFTIPAGARVARELLDRDAGATAILAGNDLIALGCLETLAAAGLRCPDDVSIAGHNDMPFVDRLTPPLTTVAIRGHEIGAAAARLVLELLGGQPPAQRHVLLPTELVVRGSTAPPPTG